MEKGFEKKIAQAVEIIKKQYFADDRNIPWLIGYSGGKDSTCTAQLIYKALIELKSEQKKLNRKIYIFSSDTMIENPLVKKIVDENIFLINQTSQRLNLPIEALILKPEPSRTFWVNVIGRGYPTPNTMFRWCTDRLKIEPANNFVHKCIDKNGEVIMVLGVREGESNTRDRVLKNHSIEGEVLMKHTTLNNAYVFPPIKHLTSKEVFQYLLTHESPWGSNNKDLYFFYEESGGGDCPTFLSTEEKKSSNSCGNSRLGCWVCTVVSKDKSLTGFINTGCYEHLKPLLDFRNWIVSIRDNDSYRCRYRNNGTVYTKKITKKVDSTGEYLSIPQKGDREKIIIRINENGSLTDSCNQEYPVVEINNLSNYIKKNNYTFKSKELAQIILYDRITGEYSRLGVGPFTDEAKIEILEKLLETEYKFNCHVGINEKIQLISDIEILEIKKIWNKNGMSETTIDKLLEKYARNKIVLLKDSFEIVNQKYESKLKKKLKTYKLEYEIVNKLLLKEKDLLAKDDRKEIQNEIEALFNADRRNF